MRIGVISDTHGHMEQTREAVRMLESMNVEEILHCGDIGEPSVVRLFDGWMTHFVLGNIDHEEKAFRREIEGGGHQYHGRFGEIELAGMRIALLHGDDEGRLEETIESGEWHLVCHGHTHVARQDKFGQTLVLNPGAIHHTRIHSVATVDLPSLEAWILPF